MMLILLVLAALLPMAAVAQPDEKAPACVWHSQPATLSWGITTEPPGAWATWWCPTDRFSPWSASITAVRFDLLGKAATTAGGVAIQAKDQTALVALRDRSVHTPELASVWLQGLDETLRARPPGPVWIVAPNGTAATRPAYPIVNGVRGATSTGRAEVRATCDCKVRSVEGASVYCATNEARTLVALCRPL